MVVYIQRLLTARISRDTEVFVTIGCDGTQCAIHHKCSLIEKLKRSFLRSITVLYWALMFLVVALVAAALGFGGIAGTAAGIAKILFFVFLVFFIVSLIAGATRRRPI
jgi:uncharacterized membrane protein YtjA (UPF0391 family)